MVIILLGYLYYRWFGNTAALINIGLTSFIAATQFAPSLIGGLYWQRATRRGATVGLIFGFVIWFYTLLIPSFAQSGWLSAALIEEGLFGLALLKPTALFGLTGFDLWTHSLFWTMFFNIGFFVTLSLLGEPTVDELRQSGKFVDVYDRHESPLRRTRITKAPSIIEFVELMAKFIGEKQAHAAIAEYIGNREINAQGSLSEQELLKLKHFTELTLARSVGSAPARIIIENYLSARGSHMEDVFDIFGSVSISRSASREQLSVLYETARTIASGNDLKSILDEILEIFTDQFKFDLCVIRILDEERQTLTVRSQRGMSSKHFGESERNLSMDTFIGETFLTNQVSVVNDTDFMSKPKTAAIIHREGIRSLAHAPITIEGESIGVLSAFSRSAKGIFTDEFVELFTSLAGLVVVAWRNDEQTGRLIAAREQQRELAIAKNIQLGLLPASIPQIPAISLAGLCLPAKDVGGDYYDFLCHDDNRLDLVIADVSGHNIGAALIMAETRSMIRSRSNQLVSPVELMTDLNQTLYDDLTRAELFITMFYMQFDPKTRLARFSSAGHSPPVYYQRSNRQCLLLDAEGLIIGVKRDFPYEQQEIILAEGDLLLLCGDVPLLRTETLQGLRAAHRRTQAAVTVLTAQRQQPAGYGRIVRGDTGVERIVEERDATEQEKRIDEINTGIYLFRMPCAFDLLRNVSNQNAQGEYYLTDIVAAAKAAGEKVAAHLLGDPHEAMGINDRLQLAEATALMRNRINRQHLQNGVTLIDPETTYIDMGVSIGSDTIVHPGSHLHGATVIGAGCVIEPGVMMRDCLIGERVHLKSGSVLAESRVGNDCAIGPMAHLRPGTVLAGHNKLGNFVETKKAELGERAQASHLTYLGDATIGRNVNIGCGTITCNYDGVNKYRTVIEDDVFVGSDTQFVAPVTIGKGSLIGAGSTITKDVPPDALALSRTEQKVIAGWAAKKRARQQKRG